MPSTRSMLLGALGALGALFLPCGSAAAQVGTQRVDTAFTFDSGGSVHLGLVSGEIRVVAGSGNQIRIIATIERGRLETSLSRSRVSIDARSINGRMGVTRYDLTVPVGTRVHASSVSGEITVRGTKSEVDANAVSGDILIDDATGVVDVGTVSGDMEVARVSGRVDLSTVSGIMRIDDVSGELDVGAVSGEISIRRGQLRMLRVESVSADITYDGTVPSGGTHEFNSHSGDIRFSIPADGGAALELETWSGEITSDFPLTLQPGEGVGRRNRRMQFTIGSGGARISAETFSGNITIRRAAARGTQE